MRSNAAGTSDTSSLQYDGEVATDLMDGIYKAYVAGATYSGVTIELLLETEMHVIT